MATLKHDAVIERWNAIVQQGAGKEKRVMDNIERRIKEAQMPNVFAGQEQVGGGLFSAKRNFLVVTNSNMRDFRMYIAARDFGIHLDVSWYVTIEPRFLKRTLSKYTTGNPQALSMQVDFFSQQDLSAFVGVAKECVQAAVKELMTEMEQDPESLNTRSKGFLELW